MISLNNECPVSRNIRLLQDSNPKIRRNAAETLGRSMNKNAIKPLIELLKVEQTNEVRRAIVLALSLLGGDETLKILLKILVTDTDLETRRNAAGGLRFFSDKVKALDLVKLLLKETDKTVRDVLVGTTIYLRDSSIVPESIEIFNSLKDIELKGCILEIIGSFDTSEGKEILKEHTSSEYEEGIRLIATRALGKFDDVSLIPHIYEISQKDNSEEIKEYAHKVLDEMSIILGFSSIDQMVLEYLDIVKE